MATSKKPMPLLVRAKETTPPSVMTGGRLIDDLAALGKVTDDLLFLLQRPNDGMNYKGTFLQLKNEVLSKSYGIIYTHDGDTDSPQSSQVASSSPTILSTWNADGLSNDMTIDFAAGKITATVAGVYEVDVSISFSGSIGKTYEVEIYLDDISASPTPTKTNFDFQRKLGTGGDVGSAGVVGLVQMEVGDSIMLYMKSTDGGTAWVTHYAQLKVTRV